MSRRPFRQGDQSLMQGYWGHPEKTAAVISLYEGATLSREEVLSFCNQQLPHYMVPDVIEFRQMLPKTSTGKTDRVSLAQPFSSWRTGIQSQSAAREV